MSAMPALMPNEATRAQLRELATQFAQEAGRYIIEKRPRGLGVAATKSSDVDVVTVMDQGSEKLLRALIEKARPEDGILGEEGASKQGTSGLTWVVDPIDGTVNYLYEHLFYAVSVAVVIGDVETDGAWESVAGAVCAPALGETFTAAVGMGADLRTARGTQKLQVNEPAGLDVSLVGTGFAYSASTRALQGEAVAKLLPQVRDIRRGGAAALDLCFVGSGRLDAYFESGTNSWDRAAGQLVATEAGAILSGKPGQPAGKTMTIAAAPSIHAPLVNCLFP